MNHTNNDSNSGEGRRGKLTDLPDDVFRQIHEFHPIDVLLLQWNRYFHAMKGRLYYFKFSKGYSLQYHTSDVHREQVQRRISDVSRQLSLELTGSSNITDVSALGGVHTLNLSGCSSITDVSALGGVHTLNLSDCSSITDVSALGGVHTRIK